MQNIMATEDRHIQTAYGIFGDVSSYQTYDTGELASIMLSDKNVIVTHAGELIPAYTETMRRKNKPAVEFYKNGMIKSVYLEECQEIHTPIGDFPVEFVTFYSTGEIKRIFPREGKISGFWSEEEEGELQIPFRFDLGFTDFQAKISSICFYKEGEIRSITLYPGERIMVHTRYGDIEVRNGFSLYEGGKLKSCEPSRPVEMHTLIGTLTAYNPNAVGICADSNSLVFYEDGTLASLITMGEKVAVQTDKERFLVYAPTVVEGLTEDDTEEMIGLPIYFEQDGVRFKEEKTVYRYDENGFSVLPFYQGGVACSPSKCSSCSLCK